MPCCCCYCLVPPALICFPVPIQLPPPPPPPPPTSLTPHTLIRNKEPTHHPLLSVLQLLRSLPLQRHQHLLKRARIYQLSYFRSFAPFRSCPIVTLPTRRLSSNVTTTITFDNPPNTLIAASFLNIIRIQHLISALCQLMGNQHITGNSSHSS